MRLPPAAIASLLLLAMVLPVAAQDTSVPHRDTIYPRPELYLTPTPSPEQLAAADSGENYGTTSVARTLYTQLAAGDLNRSHMTAQLSQEWAPQLQSKAAAQLASFGSPNMTFIGNTTSPAGAVSVYRLAYPAHALFMSVGVADNGVVYALRISDHP